MPATRIDNKRKADLRNGAYRRTRLPALLREAYDLTPQEARTAIIGASAQTCKRRTETPQDLTLREIAQFIKFGYAPEQDVLNVVGMFLAEIAKD